MICDKDCFHCQYPDCINETMDVEDYQESREREEALLRAEEKAKKARDKEYYDNNRAKIAEKSRAYYASHREYFARYREKYYAENRQRCLAYQRRYAEKHRERIAEESKKWRQKNREKYDQAQKKLAMEIQALGLSKAAAARLLGVSRTMVGYWCDGSCRCDVAEKIAVLRNACAEKERPERG